MKIEFVDRKSDTCTIRASGTMYIPSHVLKLLNLTNTNSFKIGINSNDKEDKNLYIIVDNKIESANYKLVQSGTNSYFSIKKILDSMGIDYVNNIITYTVIPFKNDGVDMFKFEFNSEKR